MIKKQETRKLYAAIKKISKGFQAQTLGCKSKKGEMKGVRQEHGNPQC